MLPGLAMSRLLDGFDRPLPLRSGATSKYDFAVPFSLDSDTYVLLRSKSSSNIV